MFNFFVKSNTNIAYSDNLIFDRFEMFSVYKNLIKTAQIMYCNGWNTINGDYTNEECIIISYAVNYLTSKDKGGT